RQQLRTTNPRYAALHYPQPLTLAEVQQGVLQDGEVLLEYVLGAQALHLFIVSRTSCQALTLPVPARTLRTTLRQFLAPLRQSSQANDGQPFRRPLPHLARGLAPPL